MTSLTPNTLLFGGAFDPPHIGHWEAVRGLLQLPGVVRIIAVPTARAPHKANLSDAHHRMQMARLCFETFGPRVEVSDFEMKAYEQNQAPSYTYETLRHFSKLYPRLAWVLGSDQLVHLPQWHRFPDLLDQSDWVVLERKPESSAQIESGIRNLIQLGLLSILDDRHFRIQVNSKTRRLQVVETQAKNISSTEIRSQIALTGHPPETLLTQSVNDYLIAHGLYGTQKKGFNA